MFGQPIRAEPGGQAFIDGAPGASRRSDRCAPVGGQRHTAGAGVLRIGDALDVPEAFQFDDGLGGALLGHVQLGGQFPDGGPGVVDEVLEDVAVREAEIAEALFGELLLHQLGGGEADEEREAAGVQIVGGNGI